MNDKMLSNRINRLKDEVTRFRNAVTAYETTDYSRYPSNFAKLGMDVVVKAEQLACHTREIVNTFGTEKEVRMMRAVSDAHGIKVQANELGYEIIMPGLMPRRGSRNNVQFILPPLTYALEEYGKKCPIERMQHATIWFIYEYAEGTPARKVRDYDNLEAKEVLDVVNSFFLLDDSGEYCQLHFSTFKGKENRTHIVISEDISLMSGIN